jgi:hypothetical protein
MSEAPVPDGPRASGEEPPKSLLQQMEELLAAVSADLSRLDANLQGSTPAPADELAD